MPTKNIDIATIASPWVASPWDQPINDKSLKDEIDQLDKEFQSILEAGFKEGISKTFKSSCNNIADDHYKTNIQPMAQKFAKQLANFLFRFTQVTNNFKNMETMEGSNLNKYIQFINGNEYAFQTNKTTKKGKSIYDMNIKQEAIEQFNTVSNVAYDTTRIANLKNILLLGQQILITIREKLTGQPISTIFYIHDTDGNLHIIDKKDITPEIVFSGMYSNVTNIINLAYRINDQQIKNMPQNEGQSSNNTTKFTDKTTDKTRKSELIYNTLQRIKKPYLKVTRKRGPAYFDSKDAEIHTALLRAHTIYPNRLKHPNKEDYPMFTDPDFYQRLYKHGFDNPFINQSFNDVMTWLQVVNLLKKGTAFTKIQAAVKDTVNGMEQLRAILLYAKLIASTGRSGNTTAWYKTGSDIGNIQDKLIVIQQINQTNSVHFGDVNFLSYTSVQTGMTKLYQIFNNCATGTTQTKEEFKNNLITFFTESEEKLFDSASVAFNKEAAINIGQKWK